MDKIQRDKQLKDEPLCQFCGRRAIEVTQMKKYLLSLCRGCYNSLRSYRYRVKKKKQGKSLKQLKLPNSTRKG